MAEAKAIRMPRRFDYSSSGDFNLAVTNALGESSHIVLDGEVLDYIDSAGIGLLVMAQKRAQSQQAKVSMINLKPAILEILQLANLQKIIDIR
ncbi:STAS domain-containing protein [Cellvibrio japonicus]|uniref:Putative SpoIIAA family protein n=1 Tax=Cellvibrio japonicus (strain Ueda107) TaxID=498211 RepID=B3PLM1_CELJU|nr:STAS domain-containing protein [Cellvibrio japonicus]ACE83231.1 putative SpoIIAA family protein [Cellvibrio japonicus Ueda107]QEI13008.1 STAS domain-containing protein [Cellvibrio japonicus]QEI16582.1 STAS domain-containing protein [Cellvibrio japonicus]QEI20160.1 STAS domain-containing protein [Cellvibrio japonicus]